jgi:hypothetical protein
VDPDISTYLSKKPKPQRKNNVHLFLRIFFFDSALQSTDRSIDCQIKNKPLTHVFFFVLTTTVTSAASEKRNITKQPPNQNTTGIASTPCLLFPLPFLPLYRLIFHSTYIQTRDLTKPLHVFCFCLFYLFFVIEMGAHLRNGRKISIEQKQHIKILEANNLEVRPSETSRLSKRSTNRLTQDLETDLLDYSKAPTIPD